MRISRWVAGPCIVSLLAAGTVVGAATSAAAVPSDCGISFNAAPRTVSSLCTSGTGEHRIRMTLKHFDPSVGTIPIEGPWVGVGSYSTAQYPPHQIIAVWVDKR
jgi:hypothetical protein